MRPACSFERHPGSWEVTELPRNEGAIRFWRRVIEKCTGGDYVETSGSEVRQTFQIGAR